MKKIQHEDIKNAKTENGIDKELLYEVIKKELDIDVDLDRGDVVVRKFELDEKLEKSVAMLNFENKNM